MRELKCATRKTEQKCDVVFRPPQLVSDKARTISRNRALMSQLVNSIPSNVCARRWQRFSGNGRMLINVLSSCSSDEQLEGEGSEKINECACTEIQLG